MARTMRRRRIRYQRLGRLRRNSRQFLAWLREHAARLSIPVRVLRDRLRLLGPMYASQVEAAEDAGDIGVVSSTAATVDLVRLLADPEDAPFTVGARVSSPVRLGAVSSAATLQLGATFTGTVSFAASTKTISRATGDFLADGFRPGATITVADSADNDGSLTLVTVEALAMTVEEAVTDGTDDEGVTISSLNVITRAEGSFVADGFVANGTLTLSGEGSNAGEYAVGAVEADHLILDDPLTIVEADFEDGASSADVMSRAAGSFAVDGILQDDVLTISSATDSDNDGDVTVVEVGAQGIVLDAPFAGALGPDPAADVAARYRISRDAGDFETDGFVPGLDVFVDGALAGVVDSFSDGGDVMLLAEPMPLFLAGTSADVVASRSTIVRASGDFESDGFTDGDRVLLVGSDANDGEYTVHDVDTLTLTLDGDRFSDSEDDVEADLFVINPKGRG